MTHKELYTLHEILGSLMVLITVVDETLNPSVGTMINAMRDILDNYWEE